MTRKWIAAGLLLVTTGVFTAWSVMDARGYS